jgi:polyphosphate kinase
MPPKSLRNLSPSSKPVSRSKTEGKGKPLPAARGKVRHLNDSALYVNRELSLLAFQRRVLEEAQDEKNPLLDRVKFLSIVGSNLDEFFMVRVAGLAAQCDAGIVEFGPDGLSPVAQLTAIRREVKQVFANAHECLQKTLLPELEKQGIRLLDFAALDDKQREVVNYYFSETVFPVLTPLAFDPGRPFPHISNLSLNLAVLIRDRRGVEHFARIKVPDTLPQLVPASFPKRSAKAGDAPREVVLVWLEQIIAGNLTKLFPGMEVVEAHPFHVTRDADMAIKELEAEDLLETIEEGVRQRRFGSVVRLKVNQQMPAHILEILKNNLEVDSSEVYRVKGPLGLSRLMTLFGLDRPDLKEKTFLPAAPAAFADASEDDDMFSVIRRQDVLLHHPFDSFQPVVDMLRKAARDPNVLAIKMVLYRVGRNSPVVEALLEAQANGKQVAVLVELKARFDEESNIEWARALEAEGVHVVYGLLGLKIHCKVAMVVRMEAGAVKRYIHLATGNYNVVTAHLYTDIGMFTCDDAIGEDVSDLFNYLTGYSSKSDYRKLLVAPVNLRERFEKLILREIELHAKSGSGHLIFKTNSLVDPPIIRLLYRASQAGVKVELLVRGACSLLPGVPGISENITVTSIVGRFLEHTRIYYFRNGGKEELYLGSADLMPRNINRRVETLFPVGDPTLAARVKDSILAAYLADNVKARQLNPDGTYSRKKPAAGKSPFNSQASLIAGPKTKSNKKKKSRLAGN